jgi:predicted RNase H-like nuclease
VTFTHYLGVDLAWREGRAGFPANETGVAVIDSGGQVLDAGWRRGVDEAVAWAGATAGGGEALMFVDAPLVVRNKGGQRLCETQVGQRYGRWKVSANTTNLQSPRLAGTRFLALAKSGGWEYSDGSGGPPAGGRVLSESYPYATLVGAPELGYGTERPRYKRKPGWLPVADWRRERAATCDTLISRLSQLDEADPPLLLHSHPVTRQLTEEPSPISDVAYKHREDLIDALLCAWTAALWARHGLERCQVLGLTAESADIPAATIVVPARPEQRRLSSHSPSHAVRGTSARLAAGGGPGRAQRSLRRDCPKRLISAGPHVCHWPADPDADTGSPAQGHATGQRRGSWDSNQADHAARVLCRARVWERVRSRFC